MKKKLKSFLLGRPLKSTELSSEKYSVLWGLPVLSSDAISSVSYACEEVLMVLVPILGMAAYSPLLGVVGAIIGLLLILVFSYRQTIDAYPHGGGSYIVASDNLGKGPGLIAAASLSIDYILTVAVSVSAGTAAITSAFPALLPYKVAIAVGIVLLLTLGNLRGMRESAVIFGTPTYFFIGMIVVMIVVGMVKVLVLGHVPAQPENVAQATGDLTFLLFLKAFSSGCTALTGIEAVSDGIPNFKDPAQKHAKIVLGILAGLVFLIFFGVSSLAGMYHAVPGQDMTVLAQIAAQVFGQNSVFFYLMQAATALILTLAANTAFADLPLLLSIVSKDGYVPRQFTSRGSRLSFSNGILLLCAAALALILIFGADQHGLMPLYAVGVFLSFTLSQAGMFRYWHRHKKGHWKHKAFINGLGAIVTAITCVIITVIKFTHGAWIVVICIPALAFFFTRIHKHYTASEEKLDAGENAANLVRREGKAAKIIVPLQSVNKSFIKALNCAISLGGQEIEVYHVSTDEAELQKVREQYEKLGLQIPLVVEEAPYRDVYDKIVAHIQEEERKLDEHQMLSVVLPHFVIKNLWHRCLHNQTAMRLERAFYKMRNVSVISMPYVL